MYCWNSQVRCWLATQGSALQHSMLVSVPRKEPDSSSLYPRLIIVSEDRHVYACSLGHRMSLMSKLHCSSSEACAQAEAHSKSMARTGIEAALLQAEVSGRGRSSDVTRRHVLCACQHLWLAPGASQLRCSVGPISAARLVAPPGSSTSAA